MTEETRANLGIAIFTIICLGAMIAVMLYDSYGYQQTVNKAEEAQQECELKCVITPIVEPPANCLPAEDEPLIEELDLSGIEFDYTPGNYQ